MNSRPSLVHEPSDHPCGRRAGRAVSAVYRLQGVSAAPYFGKLQPNEPPCRQISPHARLRHVSPSDSCKKKGVLRTKVRQTPSLSGENADVLAFGK
jgi:hypothetical protein